MSFLDNSDFVNLLVMNTCMYEDSAKWLTAVIDQGGRNLRGNEKYKQQYGRFGNHKADDILDRLQPMQRIYYRFCVVRQIMMVTLSNLPLVSSSEKSFEQYILNALANPDATLKERMYHSFRKSRIGNPESRIGTRGVVPMLSLHNDPLNVGPTSFDIDDTVSGMPVEKIRLNFFLNVWDFIYKFKLELELEDQTIPGHISDINYMFPIFGVPIDKVGFFSPTFLKILMRRIQEETTPLERTKETEYLSDNDVDSSYKYDLLKISQLYYDSLKNALEVLEIELRQKLYEYAAEFRGNNEKSTKSSKDIIGRLGPRGPRGGSKTKRQRKQRRRKQKSRTKKN
jgi:hypothetical protein